MLWLQTAVLILAAPSGGDVVLLDFYADWCAPCRQMSATIDRLSLGGYPVRKINVDRDRATAGRYRVDSLPTFILVAGGREIGRVEGLTSYDHLAGMFEKAALEAKTARAAGPKAMPAEMPSPTTPGASLPVVASGPPADGQAPLMVPIVSAPTSPAAKTGDDRGGWAPLSLPVARRDGTIRGNPALVREASVSEATVGAEAAHRSTVAPDARAPVTNTQLIASTVRLRIEDPTGHSCGSGTIIDAREGWALILTCGHLFRDSQGKGAIDVDLFGPSGSQRVRGELVSYDSGPRDIGLLRIRVPGRVMVAPVAPRDYRIAVGAPVASAGCNNGANPTVQRTRIRAKDKFDAPPNLQVDGLPVEGRSGGGLFSSEGYVIGVCNAADPTDNAGLYAALASIHAELDRTNLSYVYHRPSRQPPGRWTPVPTAPQGEVVAITPPAMPAKMPPPAALADSTAAGPMPTSARHTAPPTVTAGNLSPEEVAALEEIRRRKAEGAEVICIIRAPNDPTGKSEILRLDKASPAFLEQLASEASRTAR